MMSQVGYEALMQSRMWGVLERLGCVVSNYRNKDNNIRPLKIDVFKIIHLTDRQLEFQPACGPVIVERIHALQKDLRKHL